MSLLSSQLYKLKTDFDVISSTNMYCLLWNFWTYLVRVKDSILGGR